MFRPNCRFGLRHCITVPLRAAPWYASTVLLLEAVRAILPSMQAVIVAKFIETVLALVRGESVYLLPAIGKLALLVSVSMLLPTCMELFDTKLRTAMRLPLRTAYVDKLARTKYAVLEDAETWKLLFRITQTKREEPVYPEELFSEMFSDLLLFLRICVSVLCLAALLSMQLWWMGPVLIVLSVPLMWVSYVLGKKNYALNASYKEYTQASAALGETLLNRPFIFERYLFGYAPRLNEKWQKNYTRIRDGMLKNDVKEQLIMKLGGVLGTVVAILMILMLAVGAVQGTIGIGLFLALVSVLFELSQVLSWELSYSLYSIARSRELLRDFTAFAALPEDMVQDGDAVPIIFDEIEFRDVCFRYPGSEAYVLDGVSFMLEKGRHYAFVGANGAGKTTITKLLTGLYSDYEGKILLSGRELREFPRASLYRTFAVVFQDYARYALPLRDNITVGRERISDERMKRAAELAGLDETVAGLPRGFDMPLGKLEKDSTELSGGQWQRIAMARALASDAPMKILDEPTAALDPISESRVYEQFGRISEGAATIFISHRLGSTRLADEILVLDKGRIVEQGTHVELMRERGLYREMYESQSAWYTSKEAVV
ncbi:MAG: ABC transporter ATP-binding protein [Clostridiaceae bacterium]|nr:ABC transporter ATP-binding protein [Clostridiaceae bacterium]